MVVRANRALPRRASPADAGVSVNGPDRGGGSVHRIRPTEKRAPRRSPVHRSLGGFRCLGALRPDAAPNARPAIESLPAPPSPVSPPHHPVERRTRARVPHPADSARTTTGGDRPAHPTLDPKRGQDEGAGRTAMHHDEDHARRQHLAQFTSLVESVGVKRFAASMGLSPRQINRMLSGAQPDPVDRIIRALDAADPEIGDRVLDYVCQELGGHFVRHESIDDAAVNAVRESAEAIAAISDGKIDALDVKEVREAISALSALIMAVRRHGDPGRIDGARDGAAMHRRDHDHPSAPHPRR